MKPLSSKRTKTGPKKDSLKRMLDCLGAVYHQSHVQQAPQAIINVVHLTADSIISPTSPTDARTLVIMERPITRINDALAHGLAADGQGIHAYTPALAPALLHKVSGFVIDRVVHQRNVNLLIPAVWGSLHHNLSITSFPQTISALNLWMKDYRVEPGVSRWIQLFLQQIMENDTSLHRLSLQSDGTHIELVADFGAHSLSRDRTVELFKSCSTAPGGILSVLSAPQGVYQIGFSLPMWEDHLHESLPACALLVVYATAWHTSRQILEDAG